MLLKIFSLDPQLHKVLQIDTLKKWGESEKE